MLNFNQNTNVVADNEITINGTSFGMLSDEDTKRLISIIRGMQSGSRTTSTPTTTVTKSTKSTKKSTHTPAKDAEVKYKRAKNVLTLDGYVGRDTFAIIRENAEKEYNATYTKGVGFTFKSVKDATAFAKQFTTVSADVRNAYRKTEWGW